MASVFSDFKAGHAQRSGSRLAAALTPVAPANDRNRLIDFYSMTNSAHAEGDIRHHLLHDKRTGTKLSKQQGNAWVHVFHAYWTAISELVQVQQEQGSWLKVFEAWKELTNQLIRAYSSNHFAAWTINCLFVGVKDLRAFAINADAVSDSSQNAGAFGNGFQDDVVANVEKNANLEEAARTINRMFTLCVGDR
jgi:hypothetical protein